MEGSQIGRLKEGEEIEKKQGKGIGGAAGKEEGVGRRKKKGECMSFEFFLIF